MGSYEGMVVVPALLSQEECFEGHQLAVISKENGSLSTSKIIVKKMDDPGEGCQSGRVKGVWSLHQVVKEVRNAS